AHSDAAGASAWIAHPGPGPGLCLFLAGSFLLAGLGPCVYGAWHYALALIHTLAGRSPAIPGMTAARAEYLDPGMRVAMVGLLVAFGLCVVVLGWASPAARRARRRATGSPDGDRAWRWSAACLVVAAALFVVSRPMRAENETPWPEPPQGEQLHRSNVRTADLEGPDPIERSLIVTIFPCHLDLDGMPKDEAGLERDLVTLYNNYRMIHPNGAFSGLILVLCAPETDLRQVRTALAAANRAGYHHPSFALRKRWSVNRPMLGTFEGWRWSAANALLEGAAPLGA